MLLTQQHGEGSLCLAPLGVYNKKEKKKNKKEGCYAGAASDKKNIAGNLWFIFLVLKILQDN